MVETELAGVCITVFISELKHILRLDLGLALCCSAALCVI